MHDGVQLRSPHHAPRDTLTILLRPMYPMSQVVKKDFAAFTSWSLSSIVLFGEQPPHGWADAVAMFSVNMTLVDFLSIVDVLRSPSSSAKTARARAVEQRLEHAPYNINNVVERQRFIGLLRLFVFTLCLPATEKPTKERGSPPAGCWPYYVDSDVEVDGKDHCGGGTGRGGVKEVEATTRKATDMESQTAGAVRQLSASSGEEGQGEKKTAAPPRTYADLLRSSAAAVAAAAAAAAAAAEVAAASTTSTLAATPTTSSTASTASTAEANAPHSAVNDTNDGVTVSLETDEPAPVFGGVRDRVNTLEEHDDAAAGLAPAENTAEEKGMKGDGDG